MGVMDMISVLGHEQVIYCHDKETKLKAIIAVHDTTLGPALGGCRFWNYRDEHEALIDVLRLARGMTYKAAISGLRLGGGKSVIIGDPETLKSESFFRSFGRFVNSLGGRYITAEDVNIRVEDISDVAKETKYVVGASAVSGGSGDPAPLTALGVYHGIKAAVDYYHKAKTPLQGMTIAIQGCGAVGRNLAKLLDADGVKLIVADINKSNADYIASSCGAKVVATDDIHKVAADVFSPCALGGILNATTIDQIGAPIVAGGANNQLLEEDSDGKRLLERKILYATDYVINAGGLINVAEELSGYSAALAKQRVASIYATMTKVFEVAAQKNIASNEASDELAKLRIASAAAASPDKRLAHTYASQEWIKG